MNLPITKHHRVKYRNGQRGTLLTTVRQKTSFPVITLCDEHNNFFYHGADGKYLGLTEEKPFDIVSVL